MDLKVGNEDNILFISILVHGMLRKLHDVKLSKHQKQHGKKLERMLYVVLDVVDNETSLEKRLMNYLSLERRIYDHLDVPV